MCGIQDFQPTFRPWALNDAAYERAKKLSFKAMNLDAETAYWGFTDFEEVTEEFTMEQVRLGKPEAEKTDRLAEGGGDLLDRMMDKVEATLMKRYEIPGGKNVWMKLEDFDEEEEEDFDEEEEEDWDEEEEEDSDEEEEELFPKLGEFKQRVDHLNREIAQIKQERRGYYDNLENWNTALLPCSLYAYH
ncbi:hypothetical protein SLS58_007174 [Diplodia intermedia]|uniref:Uncharacterized protein n=1 Tax=Diplodia intermedia TaxID=856260 RepID=A0ABR3TKX7_9PEZI